MSSLPPSAAASDLQRRLSTFIPDLAAANDELEVERAAGTLGDRNIEDVDEQSYIEMNLGLGVLEEKRHSESGSETSDDNRSLEGENEGDEAAMASREGEGLRNGEAETDVLGKLLRRKKSKVDIQVVDAG